MIKRSFAMYYALQFDISKIFDNKISLRRH